LYTATLRQAESLGPDGCTDIDGRDAEGNRDHTHLGPEGRQTIGALAAADFLKLFPTLR
jgi:hypothetical protein